MYLSNTTYYVVDNHRVVALGLTEKQATDIAKAGNALCAYVETMEERLAQAKQRITPLPARFCQYCGCELDTPLASTEHRKMIGGAPCPKFPR